MPNPKNPPNNAKITNFFKRNPSPKPSKMQSAPSDEEAPNTSSSTIGPSSSPVAADDNTFKQPGSSASQLKREASTSSLSQPPSSAPEPAKPRVIPSSDGEESSDDSDGEINFPSFRNRTSKPAATQPNVPPPKTTKSDSLKVLPTMSTKKRPAPTNSLEKLRADVEKRREQTEKLRILRESMAKRESGVQPTVADVSGEDVEEYLGPELANGRLVSALKRKEAFKVEEVWKFFDPAASKAGHAAEFPVGVVSDHPVFGGMNDVFNREDMFLSGFVVDMAACGEYPPVQLVSWMLDQVCLERRQDLSWAYFCVLETIFKAESAAAQEFKDLLTRPRARALWQSLGAEQEALGTQTPIKLSAKPDKAVPYDDSWNLGLLIKLLGGTTDVSNKELTVNTCATLIRAALDDRIQRESDVIIQASESLEAIFKRIPDECWLSQTEELGMALMNTIVQPKIRLQALDILPPRTQRVHLFRRRLALAFLFDDPSYFTRDYEELVDLARFTALLERGQAYKIRHDTDYVSLRALVRMLDMAVDTGATGVNSHKDSEVDRLVDVLRCLFSAIPDSNAANISRTEAKEGMERIQFRLIFSVRKKSRQALDGPLGSKDGKVQKTLPFMASALASAE